MPEVKKEQQSVDEKLTDEQKVAKEQEKAILDLEATQKQIQEEQAKLEATKAEITDYETRKEALDKELERVQSDIAKAKEERRQTELKDKSFQERLRSENLEAAKAKFFSSFNYKPEDKDKLLEAFKKFDSQAVNVDLIYKDLVKAHVSLNADKYVQLENEIKQMKVESEKLNSFQSSSGFSGGETPPVESITLTEDDIRAAKWTGLSLERYKELKAKGLIE